MATLWIIDGYNFIRQSRRFAELEARNHDQGKKEALLWLAKFSDRTGERLRVVFDAYSRLENQPLEKSVFGLEITESRGSYTADEEIAALAQEKKQGAIIISSDRWVQNAAIKAGASILSSGEFEREVAKILAGGSRGEPNFRGKTAGNAFRPPQEKKKAYQLLKKYQ